MDPEISLFGFLYKKSPSFHHRWQKRYFWLLEDGNLIYSDMESERPTEIREKGRINVADYALSRQKTSSSKSETDKFVFILSPLIATRTSGLRAYELAAESSNLRSVWLKEINRIQKVVEEFRKATGGIRLHSSQAIQPSLEDDFEEYDDEDDEFEETEEFHQQRQKYEDEGRRFSTRDNLMPILSLIEMQNEPDFTPIGEVQESEETPSGDVK